MTCFFILDKKKLNLNTYINYFGVTVSNNISCDEIA